MEIDEILDYAAYFLDKRFANKIPDYTKGKVIWKSGDNIYQPLPNGEFHQLQSMHSNGPEEKPQTKTHDLGGKHVLIGKRFYYFGASGPLLPATLEILKVGRAHKDHFSLEIITAFLDFISSHPQGVTASPTNWPDGDMSWKQQG